MRLDISDLHVIGLIRLACHRTDQISMLPDRSDIHFIGHIRSDLQVIGRIRSTVHWADHLSMLWEISDLHVHRTYQISSSSEILDLRFIGPVISPIHRKHQISMSSDRSDQIFMLLDISMPIDRTKFPCHRKYQISVSFEQDLISSSSERSDLQFIAHIRYPSHRAGHTSTSSGRSDQTRSPCHRIYKISISSDRSDLHATGHIRSLCHHLGISRD